MKQTIHISGKVIFPLKEGMRAIIAYSGKLIQTKPVKKYTKFRRTQLALKPKT